MRRPRSIVVAVVLTVPVMLAGCGASGGLAGQPSRPQPHGPGPAGLVGIWRVTGTDETAGTKLRLSVTDLSLWRPCGVAFGSWQADTETFVAETSSAVGDCATSTQPPKWLKDTTRYWPDGAGWRLVDASGRPVAGLVPGGAIGSRPDVDRQLSEPPEAGDAAAAFAEPAPLPSGLHPVTANELVGRWVPQGARPSGGPAFLQLAANGGWQASDGCNTTSGRWRIGRDSRVLVTAGPSTEIGCDNVNVAGWWAGAARAGTDGRHLVLVDPMGNVLATLTRAPVGPLMSHGPVAPR